MTNQAGILPKPKLDSDDEDMEDKPFTIDGSEVIKPEKKDKNELTVEDVDFSGKDNAQRHHTTEYEDEDVKRIVFRRGEHFDIDITFSRPIDKKKDDIRLIIIFAFGKNKKAHIELALTDKRDVKKWSANLLKQDENVMSVRISTSPTLYVGKWEFSLDVMKKVEERNIATRYTHPEPIYMLFNPWCKDDQVYMPDNDLLEEYILSDGGNVYRNTSPLAWNFGQFDPPVLECTMDLLDEKGSPYLNLTERSDPVMMVRRLSALANIQDEGGILVGNWSGDYSDGTSPMVWSGSHAIIQQYHETKYPVMYGQCWVFSGVLTTLCRTIGIPARSVTNCNSAHDTDGSMTIDKYMDKDGNEIDRMNEDSVWNFHVWNDVWMARPDLPDGYGGWQAIDATPQELSWGIFCCGPMSLTAIRRGKVDLPYDGKFIFAEVNADRIKWVQEENGSFKKLRIYDTERVGRKICTNKPKCKITKTEFEDTYWGRRLKEREEREEVTDEYKFKEGSALERLSVIAANSCGSIAERNVYEINEDQQDVEFKFELASEEFEYGKSYELVVKITNKSEKERKMKGLISSSSTYYTGVNFKKVKKETFDNITVGPNKSTKVSMKVTFHEYKDHLIDHCCLHNYCSFKVDTTRQIFMEEINEQLVKPTLTVKAPATVTVGKEFPVKVAFTNPLPIALTNCVLTVEGPGISKQRMMPQADVKADEDFTTEIKMKPARKGKRKIVANFTSKQLAGVSGSCDIEVEQ